MLTNSAILLIGSGRLAKHLQHWNSLLAQPNELICWDRTQNTEKLNSYLSKSSLVWLAISDSSLEKFYDEFLKDSQLKVVHFSGAFSHPKMLCAHPLMSFPHSFLPAEVYPQIHFAVNGTESLSGTLPGFTNSFTVLNTQDKSLYHALCVLAGNFPQLLWNEVASQMSKMNLPPEALDLYIRQITENYLLSKEKAITGPIVRRDYSTIEKNISALENTQKLNHIYTTFTKEFSV